MEDPALWHYIFLCKVCGLYFEQAMHISSLAILFAGIYLANGSGGCYSEKAAEKRSEVKQQNYLVSILQEYRLCAVLCKVILKSWFAQNFIQVLL